MTISIDLLDAIEKPVYFIDWKDLSVIEEKLVPVCLTDYLWYSYSHDKYMPETDVYNTKEEALEVLLGHVIKIKKETLLYLTQKERDILDLLSPEIINEGLIGNHA